MREWQDLAVPDLRAAADAGSIVIVPVGSIEQHGPHLPVATDSMCVAGVVRLAAERIGGRVPVLVTPVVQYGFSEDHLGFPGTISVTAAQLEETLVSIGSSIVASGFARIVLVNGHGGNDRLLYYALRRTRAAVTGPIALAATTYWSLAREELAALRSAEPGGMGHACELETSLMLHFRPETVHMERAVRDVAAVYSRYRGNDLLATGPVVSPDRWLERSRSGITGDPLVATADQGRRFAEAIAMRLAMFFEEFAGWPLVERGPA